MDHLGKIGTSFITGMSSILGLYRRGGEGLWYERNGREQEGEKKTNNLWRGNVKQKPWWKERQQGEEDYGEGK